MGLIANVVSVKRCSSCKGQAPDVSFARNGAAKDGLQNECDPCRRTRQNRWWHAQKMADPEFLAKSAKSLRRNVLLRKLWKYGLTEDRYNVLVAKGCAICEGPPNGRGRYAFDHDHKTGKFRGLLCSRCNTALGSFLDNKDYLWRAMKYLSQFEHME
jgi:hypothetical protein